MQGVNCINALNDNTYFNIFSFWLIKNVCFKLTNDSMHEYGCCCS